MYFYESVFITFIAYGKTIHAIYFHYYFNDVTENRLLIHTAEADLLVSKSSYLLNKLWNSCEFSLMMLKKTMQFFEKKTR